MKRRKVRRAPSFLRHRHKHADNLAFFDSPYYKYVIAGTAVILVMLFLGGILYMQNKQEINVLGTHVSTIK